MRFPDPNNGQPSLTDVLKFKYYCDGSVAVRRDQRTIDFFYGYDERNQLTAVEVQDLRWNDPEDPFIPAYRLKRIEYGYDAIGRLDTVTAIARDPNDWQAEITVAENKYEYDSFGNLEAEWQQHFGAVDANTPKVDYEWDFAGYDPNANSNYNRLTGMDYPVRPSNSAQHQLSFSYGSGINNALGRVVQISDTTVSGAQVDYVYAGLSRRVATSFDDDATITQDFADGSGNYTRLDRFGRVKDLHYVSSYANHDHRYQYTYDLAGNRLTTQALQATIGTAHDNDRSFAYEYDGLSRLVVSDMGKLSSGAITSDVNTPLRRTMKWALDNLGNWSGDDPNSYVIQDDTNGDGTYDTKIFSHHVVDHANRIQSQEFHSSEPNVPDPNAIDHVYDLAGNLVFDGEYWYQYDAWNRLISVHEAGDLDQGWFPVRRSVEDHLQ